MNRNPDFYITAAGECNPLAEPRACWVIKSAHDPQDGGYLVVEISAPFRPIDTPDREVFQIVLSARHRGESLAHITSWPIHVYVGRVLDDSFHANESYDSRQRSIFAWARLYPTLEEAANDADRHAVALHSVRSPEILHGQQVRFLGEQDGVPERTIKNDLIKLFSSDQRIWKAYLAKTDHGPGSPIRVTLCLRTVMGPDSTLAGKIGELFASRFRSSESMDILFIDHDLESNLTELCTPFYVRRMSRRV